MPLDNLDTVKSGDLLEVELTIDAKNDYEYILFEDMKAAGCEPVEVRSGYNDNEMGAYMELRDERVAFFVRSPGARHAQHQLPPARRDPRPVQRPAHPRQCHVRPGAQGQLGGDEVAGGGLMGMGCSYAGSLYVEAVAKSRRDLATGATYSAISVIRRISA